MTQDTGEAAIKPFPLSTKVNQNKLVCYIPGTIYTQFYQQSMLEPWTNFSWQDEPWAKFSTLGVAACNAMHFLCSIAIWPNLEFKTLPKQLVGYLPLNIALPAGA
jgi:hypothetical protein